MSGGVLVIVRPYSNRLEVSVLSQAGRRVFKCQKVEADCVIAEARAEAAEHGQPFEVVRLPRRSRRTGMWLTVRVENRELVLTIVRGDGVGVLQRAGRDWAATLACAFRTIQAATKRGEDVHFDVIPSAGSRSR